MSAYPAVAALLHPWPDLLRAVGVEWPGRYWELLDLLRRSAQAADEEERGLVALEIARVVRDLPGGLVALRAVGRPVGWRQEREWESLAAPQPDVLIVGMTRSPTDGQEVKAIQAELNQLIRVVLTPHRPQILGERSKALQVGPEEEEPVVFYLKAVQSETQSVLIDFWSQSPLLASVTRSIQAAEGPAPDEFAKSPAGAVVVGDYLAPFPDAVLRVSTQGNRLSYSVFYRDTEERHVAGEPLRADPEQYRYGLLRQVENLAQGQDADGYPLSDAPGQPPGPQDLLCCLERIGQRLYNDLFNEDMQREYRRMRQKGIRTLYIISDEPWIPWELVRPYDDEVDDAGNDFLCMAFALSRWVSGPQAPAAEIRVDSLACVAPTDSGLSHAGPEQAFLREVARRLRLADHTPATADRGSVRALLEGESAVRLWHLACHGEFDARSPGNSPLFLQHQRPLRPSDLVGRAQARLRADRPLVFLNACRVGQAGLALTGLGGWAKALVQDCHVGALIAPLWSVDDALAQRFAETFYRALLTPGVTLSEAMQTARRTVREHAPHDPTWLAYSLYAHPNARVAFVQAPA